MHRWETAWREGAERNNLQAQQIISGSEILKITVLPNRNNWKRQAKWWKMKGSAKIRPNINPTKLNSAGLLWLIQKIFCEHSVHWRRENVTSSVVCDEEPLAKPTDSMKRFLKGNTDDCNATYQIASRETWHPQPESTSAPKYWAQEFERIISLIDVWSESCQEHCMH